MRNVFAFCFFGLFSFFNQAYAKPTSYTYSSADLFWQGEIQATCKEGKAKIKITNVAFQVCSIVQEGGKQYASPKGPLVNLVPQQFSDYGFRVSGNTLTYNNFGYSTQILTFQVTCYSSKISKLTHQNIFKGHKNSFHHGNCKTWGDLPLYKSKSK